MGTTLDSLIDNAEAVAAKRRDAGFYFLDGNRKNNVVPVDTVEVEVDEPADALPVPGVMDCDSSSAEIGVSIRERSYGRCDGPGFTAVDNKQNDASDARGESHDTGEYQLPAGFPFHEGDSSG